MRKETVEALEKFKVTWRQTLSPKVLSLLRISVILSGKPSSFSELVEKTELSSKTLNKWLKEGIKQGFISRRRQDTWPWKSTYSLTKAAKPIEIMGNAIQKFEAASFHLIKGAGEQQTSTFVDPPTTEEVVDKYIGLRQGWLDVVLEMEPSWLEDPASFGYVQALFSGLNAITFWGTFFALSFPHIKGKAKEIMLRKGMVSPLEERLLKKVLK